MVKEKILKIWFCTIFPCLYGNGMRTRETYLVLIQCSSGGTRSSSEDGVLNPISTVSVIKINQCHISVIKYFYNDK